MVHITLQKYNRIDTNTDISTVRLFVRLSGMRKNRQTVGSKKSYIYLIINSFLYGYQKKRYLDTNLFPVFIFWHSKGVILYVFRKFS